MTTAGNDVGAGAAHHRREHLGVSILPRDWLNVELNVGVTLFEQVTGGVQNSRVSVAPGVPNRDRLGRYKTKAEKGKKNGEQFHMISL